MQYKTVLTTAFGVETREHTSLHAVSEYIHNLHWRGDTFVSLTVTNL
jgi:hypothetical protein